MAQLTERRMETPPFSVDTLLLRVENFWLAIYQEDLQSNGSVDLVVGRRAGTLAFHTHPQKE
jgi:hypothetical protein